MSAGDMSRSDIENVIIVGSGPAGYTAALYTARADLEPLVIEGFQWGGLLQQTTDVENYPGYPEGVMGPEMMQQLPQPGGALRHALRHRRRDPSSSPTRRHPARLGRRQGVPRARVVLAMGAEPRKLGVPGEEELAARGVSYCATCDAAFFRDKRTIIVGGGDTAMEEATFLAKFAGEVKVVHRRDEFRASAIMLDRARETENIELLTPVRHRALRGRRERLAGRARCCATPRAARTATLEIDGAFIAIGHQPNSQLVADQVERRRERLRRRSRAAPAALGGRASSPRAT